MSQPDLEQILSITTEQVNQEIVSLEQQLSDVSEERRRAENECTRLRERVRLLETVGSRALNYIANVEDELGTNLVSGDQLRAAGLKPLAINATIELEPGA